MRDALEVLRLIRAWKNMLAPINKIPPEILTLVPDFLDTEDRDERIIALTHVCRTWREAFVSRSSLWTNFDCLDGEKTRVYLERSGSSPINLSLDLNKGISLCDPLFQIIPHATGRLASLLIEGMPEKIPAVTPHLSRPAPLLRCLSICSDRGCAPERCPILASTLFNGDLSSLRTLHLELVRTEFPWRNMVNLTSFTLSHIPPGTAFAGQLLDFLESAPYLEQVELCFATPVAGAQDGRLVSLACLKSMDINGDAPCPALLDHLLIPAGAKLEITADLFISPARVHLPKSLDNLKNFSDFTTIQLRPGKYCPRMEFSGPNGQVNVSLRTSRYDSTSLTLESLAEFDTSKIEWLKIDHGHLLSGELLYRTLLPMKDLRALTLFSCSNPHIFIHALQPGTRSSEVVVCPKLEEITLVLQFERMFDITSVIEMAAARASGGRKLRIIRIIDGREGAEGADLDVSELRKHAWNVEYGPEA